VFPASDSAIVVRRATTGREPRVLEGCDWVGDRFLRLDFGEPSSSATRAVVRDAARRLAAARLPGLVDATPAYATILLAFEARGLDAAAAQGAVLAALAGPGDADDAPAREVRVEVCYDPDLGIDLADVARRCASTPDEVVALHAGAEYVVQFLGFAPGFPYLTGLPERLHVPRWDAPRPRVAAGSVAIAGGQAGVYPCETPGGWRVLGRTPRRLFDAHAASPTALAIGDRVRFVPIPRERFDRLAAEGATR
jgi:inhibitor of KinA